MFYKILNKFSYIFFALIYLLLFCFFFKTKMDSIIFVLLSVTTLFLTLQFVKDILIEFFAMSNRNDNNITQKYFNFDFMKTYPFFFIVIKMFIDIPIFVYIPICLAMIYVTFIFTYIIFIKAMPKNNSQDSLSIPISNLNIGKIKTMKTIFIFDMLFLLLLIFILKYVPNEVLSKNKGVNVANGMSIFSTVASLLSSAYLIYIDLQLNGIQNSIADGSSGSGFS